MILTADVFPKLRTPKNVIRKMSEKPGLRGPFQKKHRKRPQKLLQSLNFEHCEKKNDPHSRCISEITHSEKGD